MRVDWEIWGIKVTEYKELNHPSTHIVVILSESFFAGMGPVR